MQTSKPRKRFGTDINRYLGVQYPESRIRVPGHSTSNRNSRSRLSLRRFNSSALSFRNTMKSKVSTIVQPAATPPSENHGPRRSAIVRRWKNRSTSSAMQLETPIKDRTNTMTTSSTPGTGKGAYGGGGDTTFLPELHSTPPMPTFQKPTVTAVDTSPGSPGSPSTVSTTKDDTPAQVRRARGKSEAIPPPIHTNQYLHHPRPPTTTRSLPSTLVDRLEDTPPLPSNWLEQHDRAICLLDVRGYPLPTIVLKMRRTFPSLNGTLTAGMVDKRLRQLDQIVEVDYWRVGLLGIKRSGCLGGEVRAGQGGGGGSGSGNGGKGGRRITSGMALDEENASPMPIRVVEPTIRATASGSLVKAQSVSNLLPDSISFSSRQR